MVMDVVTAAEPGSFGFGVGTVLAYAGVVLLSALLPFVLSFVGDAVAVMLRRGRAALPFLVAAIGASVLMAGLGVLLLQLGLGLVGDAGVTDQLPGLALGLLLVCTPLAVLALVLRLVLARTRARRSPRDAAGGAEDPGTDRH